MYLLINFFFLIFQAVEVSDQSLSRLTHNLSSLNTSVGAPMIPSMNPSMNTSMNTTHTFPATMEQFLIANKSTFHANTADTTTASVDPDDSAQSILDAHVSHVWDSSTGQTPSRSPGRHSPDRIAAVAPSIQAYVDKSRSYLANTSNMSGSSFNTSSSSNKLHHHSSKRSRDKDMNSSMLSNTSATYYTVDPPEALQIHYNKQHGQVNVSGSGGSQYHHYRGSSADSAGDLPHGSRRGMHHPGDVPPPLPLRGAPHGHHWDDRDLPSAARGRARDSRRTSLAVKKNSDTGSNIDSGIGLPQEFLPGNTNDPQSQRCVFMLSCIIVGVLI